MQAWCCASPCGINSLPSGFRWEMHGNHHLLQQRFSPPRDSPSPRVPIHTGPALSGGDDISQETGRELKHSIACLNHTRTMKRLLTGTEYAIHRTAVPFSALKRPCRYLARTLSPKQPTTARHLSAFSHNLTLP